MAAMIMLADPSMALATGLRMFGTDLSGQRAAAEGDRMQDEDAARPGETMTAITKPTTDSAAGTVR